MNKYRKYIFVLIILLLLTWLFSVFLLQQIYHPGKGLSPATSAVRVERGMSASQIGDILEKEHLINSSFWFKVYSLLTFSFSRLQAGEYILSSQMTLPEIVAKMSQGDVVVRQITVPEGWNIKEIGEYLEKNAMLSSERFFELATSPAFISSLSLEFNFLTDRPPGESLEGYLFPDTYHLQYSDREEEVILRMLTNFQKKVSGEITENALMKRKSLFEVMTMASVIEKEVRSREDKEIVSGILWKRIAIGIPLQADATIAYTTGKKTILIADTKIPSLYNTYLYRGLPKGPISNPGLESIEAALKPRETSYLYYLSSPDGRTIFSRTLQEHNIAKEQYLK